MRISPKCTSRSVAESIAQDTAPSANLPSLRLVSRGHRPPGAADHLARLVSRGEKGSSLPSFPLPLRAPRAPTIVALRTAPHPALRATFSRGEKSQELPSFESRIPNPQSAIPNPGSSIPAPNPSNQSHTPHTPQRRTLAGSPIRWSPPCASCSPRSPCP